jgi:hypothetical protein
MLTSLTFCVWYYYERERWLEWADTRCSWKYYDMMIVSWQWTLDTLILMWNFKSFILYVDCLVVLCLNTSIQYVLSHNCICWPPYWHWPSAKTGTDFLPRAGTGTRTSPNCHCAIIGCPVLELGWIGKEFEFPSSGTWRPVLELDI